MEERAFFSVRRRTVSYILKLIVAVAAFTGIILSAGGGRRAFMGGSRVFMYFTIQSNIAVALICLIGAALLLRPERVRNGWYTLKFVATVSITLTGLVYCFVLAPTFGPGTWTLSNVLTHIVVPLAAVADFFVTGIGSRISRGKVLWVTLPPFMYSVYAGVAYLMKWEFADGVCYPYFFLNWGSPVGAFGFTRKLPYMGCVWWILAIFLLLIAAGHIYLWILDRLKKHVSSHGD